MAHDPRLLGDYRHPAPGAGAGSPAVQDRRRAQPRYKAHLLFSKPPLCCQLALNATLRGLLLASYRRPTPSQFHSVRPTAPRPIRLGSATAKGVIRRHSTSGIAPPTLPPNSLANHSSARGTTSRRRTSNLPDSVGVGDLTGRLTDSSFRRTIHKYPSLKLARQRPLGIPASSSP